MENKMIDHVDVQGIEFFTLRNGSTILDETLSAKIGIIKQKSPERMSYDSSGYEWSHMGMATLFGEIYKEEVRYCPEYKSWYTYSEGAWKNDVGSLLVTEKLKEFVRLMLLYCSDIKEDDLRKNYTTFITKMGDRRVREQILKDSESELKVNAEQFDTNPYLINCLNGTYDLNSFSFYEPKWSDFITSQTHFKHTISRDVSCARWEKFIDEITQGDKDKANYIQKALGYSILGKSNENCIFVLHGESTRNGKSTLVETIESMMGDYSTVGNVSLICRGKYDRNPEAATPELVKLKGKRFVTMAEPDDNARLDEQKIKIFTGGEKLTGRGLRESPISFLPQFTLWMTCNDLPAVHDRTVFASDRIRLIELNRHFTKTEQDLSLGEYFKTQEARTGIFMWLIRGYIRFTEQGLIMPDKMKCAVKKYEKDNDLVLQFLESRCVVKDGLSIKCTDLYKTFKNWAKAEGVRVLSAMKFYAEVERHSEWYESKGSAQGYAMYRGMGLKEII